MNYKEKVNRKRKKIIPKVICTDRITFRQNHYEDPSLYHIGERTFQCPLPRILPPVIDEDDTWPGTPPSKLPLHVNVRTYSLDSIRGFSEVRGLNNAIHKFSTMSTRLPMSLLFWKDV
ncbi:hypothetical protein TNCV_3220891 [Trichonephila clavipes]|nr:hypothetical protein TNCV_3220891 [Trichonephila clavipes]